MGHRPTPTEEIEAIGVERDLMGLPIMRHTSVLDTVRDQLVDVIRRTKRDDLEGLIIPDGLHLIPPGRYAAEAYWKERAIMAESMLDADEKSVLREYMEAWTANR